MKEAPKTVVITGCASGIGSCLTDLFFSKGWQVIGVDCNRVESKSIKHFFKCDLASSEDVTKLVSDLNAFGVGKIDLFLANAAVGWVGAVQDCSFESIQQLYQVNLFSNLQIIHGLGQSVKQISVISSVAVSQPTPNYLFYTATKAALEGFARSLELEGRQVVQRIRVAPTRTPLHGKVGIELSQFQMFLLNSPEKTARFVCRCVEKKGSGLFIMGLFNRVLEGFFRLRSLLDLLLSQVFRLRSSDLKRVLVTGSSKGIGHAISKDLLESGSVVDGVSRSPFSFDSANYHHHSCSLNCSNEIEKLLLNLSDSKFDMLVLNAGSSAVGSFFKIPLVEHDRILRLNFVAPFLLLSALGKRGLMRSKTRLIFTNSLCHFTRYPGAASYAASKGALAHVALSMSKLYPCSSIFLGPTRTQHAESFSPLKNTQEASSARLPVGQASKVCLQWTGRAYTQRIVGPLGLAAAVIGLVSSRSMGRLLRTKLFDRLGERVLLES